MIYTHAAALLLGLAVGFVGAWNVQGWRHDAAALEALEQARETERMRRQAMGTAADRHEAAKTAIDTKFQVITETVTHEIQTERVVYDRTCIAAGGLQQLAEAARTTGDSGQPASPVPAASAAR